MSKVFLFVSLACSVAWNSTSAFAAENGWTKVRDLKSGTELRIYRTGAKQPVMATLDEATDENLIIVTKTEQLAIPRDAIDRIDSRPAGSGKRMSRESRTTETAPDHATPPLQGQPGSSSSNTSTSTGITFGSKKDFETVYRKTASAPLK